MLSTPFSGLGVVRMVKFVLLEGYGDALIPRNVVMAQFFNFVVENTLVKFFLSLYSVLLMLFDDFCLDICLVDSSVSQTEILAPAFQFLVHLNFVCL